MTVTVEVAAGVLGDVETVRAEVTGVPPGVTDGGTNAQLALGGRPAEHVRVTGAVKPFTALTEMV